LTKKEIDIQIALGTFFYEEPFNYRGKFFFYRLYCVHNPTLMHPYDPTIPGYKEMAQKYLINEAAKEIKIIDY